MDIEGTYTLQATPQEVWACLLDRQTLQRTIPGIEELEKLGEDTYAFTMHIKHAPLRGSYSGQVDAIERQYPFSYRVIVESEGQRRIAISPSVNQPEFLHRIVRHLRPGGNHPLLEEQWVRRLRRIGIASVLLLLVWIGTRLPRKPATRQ